jgi:hypothetical protein
MKGQIRLAKVLTPASSDNGYRCDIEACDTKSVYSAICNPSPYGWVNPDINALVYFIDAPYAKRIIGVLHDIDVSTRPMSDVAMQEELPSSIGVMNPGDAYFGKYGRASFPRNGDTDIVNFSTRGRLYLENSNGTSHLSGYNLDLYTEGNPIHIYTECAAGPTAGTGDTLIIESNTPGASGTNQTTIVLGPSGDVGFRVGYGPTGPTGADVLPNTNLGLSTNGVIQFYCGGATFGSAPVAGSASAISKEIKFKSQAVGASGAQSTTANLDILGAGTLQTYVGGDSFSNAIVSCMMDQASKAMKLNTTGDFFLTATNSANITAKNLIVKAKVESTGDFKITGKTEIAGDLAVKGSTITLEGSAVNLGGSGGLALVIAQKLAAAFNAHTHTTSMGPSGPPLAPMVEAQIATIVTKAK